eukprot:TRINITY_DN2397_c0_g1_i6.p1 TRINITY_DN2397_c0_g1~~TRINITY_DN2397_c0_g1_i6.p1  ORF type:complete len:345 (+),score=66.78 TRINITY_DN2397_c0_g1_i6:62-1096(+)
MSCLAYFCYPFFIFFFFFLMIRRPPRSTLSSSSAASDVYKRQDVKKVLYHELTHNVHDDHNNEFKAFMSKLIKQGNALDWTRNGGRSTGEDMEYADVIGLGRFHRESDDDEAAFEGGVGKLGRAPDAEYWLREPEGSEPEGSEPEGSELEGSEPESLGERIRDPEPELPMQPKSLPTEDEATAQDLELMSGADTTCSLLAECEGIDLAHPDVQQLIQQEPFEDDPMDPMRDRQDRINKAIENMRLATQETQDNAALGQALTTIQTYIENVMKNLDNPRFRCIQMSNSHFRKNVLVLDGSAQLLSAIGFKEEPSTLGGKQLRLGHADPGLLWICKCLIQDALNKL